LSLTQLKLRENRLLPLDNNNRRAGGKGGKGEKQLTGQRKQQDPLPSPQDNDKLFGPVPRPRRKCRRQSKI